MTKENVQKVQISVLVDRRIKLSQIAEDLQINEERAAEISHEHLNMKRN